MATTLGNDAEFDELLRSVSQGEWRPVIDSAFSFEDVFKAHQRMEAGGHFGKIVLTFN